MAHTLFPAFVAAYLLVVVSLFIASSTVLAWMLYAWWTPAGSSRTTFPDAVVGPAHTFSLIVAARHEQSVLGATLDGLAALDHPAIEIIVVVGDDDPETAAIANAWAQRNPGLGRVVTDDSAIKNKPRALNAALPYCRGDIVGIFDAEDEVHPDLLRAVDSYISTSGADIVQGGIQLMNYTSGWWALRAVMEYYVHFRSRLHFHASKSFIPLGGNTLFVRTGLVRAAGGWDPDCLAEDCELGVRLSSLGAKTVVAYDPRLVTREETPTSMRGLFRQRIRWDQGFLQVLRKREWQRLPTRRERLGARYVLAMPFLQAGSWLVIPAELAALPFLHQPVSLELVTFVLAAPFALMLAMDVVCYTEFCRNYGVRMRVRDGASLILGAPIYQVMLAVAALFALGRELRGIRNWVKTEHVGAHRPALARAD